MVDTFSLVGAARFVEWTGFVVEETAKPFFFSELLLFLSDTLLAVPCVFLVVVESPDPWAEDFVAPPPLFLKLRKA